MNFAKRDKSIMDVFFMIALLGVFIVSALFVLLFGAKIYEKTVKDSDKNFSTRTARSYITEKIRSHDYSGGIEIISDVEDAANSIMILKDFANEKEYNTYIYVDNGFLKEYMAPAEVDFSKDRGTQILEVGSFFADKVNDGMFHFVIEDKYNQMMLFYVSLYSGSDGEEHIDG